MAEIYKLAVTGKPLTASSNQYFLKIDRFCGDHRKPHIHSSYPTCAAAISAVKEMIDGLLKAGYRPRISAAHLFDKWVNFGDDPTVIGPSPERVFSAWEYAEGRCTEIFEFHEKNGQIWEQLLLPLSF